MSELLFEIGTEELPAGFIGPASEQLERRFRQKAETLKLAHGPVRRFGTPRRLSIIVEDLAERPEDIREEILGPSKQAAYDENGTPTRAAQGFARSKGVTVEDLKVVDTPKGQYLQLVREVRGQDSEVLLPALLQEIILELSFTKSMRWGSNQQAFARPIQWILALYDNRPLVFDHEGIVAGAMTRGHRFMAPDFIEIDQSASYEKILESVYVIADIEKRKQRVLAEVTGAVAQADFSGSAATSVDEGLLDTVCNLVEYPFGICGRFETKYLQVPDEVLVTSMREHQKYFPVVNQNGELLPGFVAVNNTKVLKSELTREGHERVLRARLEDAYFFFESDKKIRLEDRVEDLGGIIFQATLGSMKDKVDRVVKLSRLLAERLAPDLVEETCRAALLCKADLTTDMVGEFPSLQGVMGAAYAAHDGESKTVSAGIKEHYLPLRAGAELPSSEVGAIVGLADRIDTIAGCFGIGQTPTGTTDPFGLRRLSLAILHIIEDRSYSLPLPEIFQKALALYGNRVAGGGETVEAVLQFVKDRFVNNCAGKKMDVRAVEAVTSVEFRDVVDSLKRISAFTDIRKEETFSVLAGSFKRIRNIVKENQGTHIEHAMLTERAEQELFSLHQELEEAAREKLGRHDYLGFLTDMLRLKEPVDRFFNEIMVMVEDERIRANRLNLLTAINNLILKVGDISRMHVGT